MKQLTISHLQFAKKGQVEQVESIPVVVKLKVDNTNYANALDIKEFLNSLENTGKLPLFTCEACGVFCCKGYYVEIEHSDNNYIMNGTYDCSDPDTAINMFRDEIPWWQIQELIQQLREAIAAIPKEYPHLKKYIGTWLPSIHEFDAAENRIRMKIDPAS